MQISTKEKWHLYNFKKLETATFQPEATNWNDATNEQTNKQTKEQKNKRKTKPTYKQTNTQTNKQTNQQTDKPTHHQTNKQTNQQTNGTNKTQRVETKRAGWRQTKGNFCVCVSVVVWFWFLACASVPPVVAYHWRGGALVGPSLGQLAFARGPHTGPVSKVRQEQERQSCTY